MEAIDTARLVLRPFRNDDADAAFSWFGDPHVMQFTPAGADASQGQTRARLQSYRTHQQLHGFSKWAVVDRESGRPIGDAGLIVLDDLGWVDLGFRFGQPWWGKGLATEVGRAWVSAAFGRFDLTALGAFVHPDNAASLRVLEKLGFRPTGKRVVMGMPAVCFVLDREEPHRGDVA